MVVRNIFIKYFFLTIVVLVFVSCKKANESKKNFEDFTFDEKLKLFADQSDSISGNYLQFSGSFKSDQSTYDSLSFIDILFDSANQFAVRLRFDAGEVKNDTATFKFMQGGHNICRGQWKDLGDKIEVSIQLGGITQFLDKERNKSLIEFVDESTARFNKSIDQIWIWQTMCTRIK